MGSLTIWNWGQLISKRICAWKVWPRKNLVYWINKQMKQDKIYGLMITGKDDYHLKLAINSAKSFLEQTYENKLTSSWDFKSLWEINLHRIYRYPFRKYFHRCRQLGWSIKRWSVSPSFYNSTWLSLKLYWTPQIV